MNIFLTMDYEVFFGEKSGTVQKCMIEPTNALMDLARKNQFHFTFFWDIGHFLALEKWAGEFSSLQTDVAAIENQVKQLIQEGHDIQLHIHPHWEKAVFKSGEWVMNLENHYKMADFPKDEQKHIFTTYKKRLEEVTGKKCHVFRAGGWCIQPFSDFKDWFEEEDIRLDSSVMPRIHWQSEQYNLDFRKILSNQVYRFTEDISIPEKEGKFWEYPISTRFYAPLFFWKLYVLGRLRPSQHKMWGDGNFVAQPGGKKEMLLRGKWHHVSTDGFFAQELESSFRKMKSENLENMIAIGHPKSLTQFSLKKIDQFTTRNRKIKRFMTLSEVV